MYRYFLIPMFSVLMGLPSLGSAQENTGSISGKIHASGVPIPYVTVNLKGTQYGAVSDEEGLYAIENIPDGEYKLLARSIGYQSQSIPVWLHGEQMEISLDISMIPSQIELNQMVITGTKTFKRKTDSPVIVNVMDSKTLERVQACNLSEALNFQTGLRVETDCQTCNYTQLRMNGLQGGYSQILINGRPLISPLTGLYGLEQIPVNMIDRIETVRGGGSSLYGSSAIGGTVNVITRLPKDDNYSVDYSYANIKGQTADHNLRGNASVMGKKKNSGASIFINDRRRDAYDHNGDGFSELPSLRNHALGANVFLLPQSNQKIELSLGSLSEYRYGGEINDQAAHLAQQSEERRQEVYLGSLDYQINFNEDNSSFIAYASSQLTHRAHYTGIFPDDSLEILAHLQAPPYGTSISKTVQLGTQINHRVKNFISGTNTITTGVEFIIDEVYDEIASYDYLIDQKTKNVGVFAQSDWAILPELDLLSGARLDFHNLLNQAVVSPRFSLLYKIKERTQLRLTYSTGFRAPQAFDTDLHIAFAGGGVSQISLSPSLQEERSRSWSTSINYDRPREDMIYGLTLEGFYTHLQGVFFQHPLGEGEFGERFEKRNGEGATVMGCSAELRANFNRKVQLEGGVTIQSSTYSAAVATIDGLSPVSRFLRTPDEYGFTNLTYFVSRSLDLNANLVFTGPMTIAHFAGAPEIEEDRYVTSPSFTNLGVKTSYRLPLEEMGTELQFYTGIENILDAYQEDFDTGKNRDSNYVYGTARPRTIFCGLRMSSVRN